MLLVAAQHLADTVVDDDRVVERIAEDGEQRRDAGQVEIDLRQRHEADRQHEIVHVGDHGAERELPFEAEPEIDQDRADREHEPDRAVGQKLGRHARPDHLDAAVLDVAAERRPHLLRPPPAAPARRPAAARRGSARRSARRTAAAAPRRGRARSASRASWRDRPARSSTAPRSACRRRSRCRNSARERRTAGSRRSTAPPRSES